MNMTLYSNLFAQVKSENGEKILEGSVEVFRVAFSNVHEVEIVVCKDRGEVGADREDVAMANEDGFDFGEFGDGFGHGLKEL